MYNKSKSMSLIILLAFLLVFLWGCNRSSVIEEMWNYRKGKELLSISLGNNNDDGNISTLYHSIYNSDGKRTVGKSFNGNWRYEDNILTIYKTVDGVEKIQLKGKVEKISRRKSITLTILEVHEPLKPMGLVGKTIRMIVPKSINLNNSPTKWRIGC